LPFRPEVGLRRAEDCQERENTEFRLIPQQTLCELSYGLHLRHASHVSKIFLTLGVNLARI